jgi:hypothetical protein
MHAQQISQDDLNLAEALETIELELALQVHDLSRTGFDAAVDSALRSLGGELLFQLPGDLMPGASQVAAVTLPNGDSTDGGRKVLLVTLDRDGETMHVQDTQAANHPVARLARSMAGVVDSFAAVNAREDEPILL